MSDNVKTFRAASKEIHELCRSEEVLRYLADIRITWTFIIEKAQWWGGFWKRLVKSFFRIEGMNNFFGDVWRFTRTFRFDLRDMGVYSRHKQVFAYNPCGVNVFFTFHKVEVARKVSKSPLL